MTTYQHSQYEGMVLRIEDDGTVWHIPHSPDNGDYKRYLADVAAGAEVLPADELPPEQHEPTRDERLALLTKSDAFTPEQKALLSVIFGGSR